MGCCQSTSTVEREQTRPLIDDNTSLEHDNDTSVLANQHALDADGARTSPKWNANAQLRAIEEKLEASMVDVSILDRHTFVSRNHSPVRRYGGGDESPPASRLTQISQLQMQPTRLTGPPSVADALSKPLPTRQSVEWGRATAEDLLGAFRADLDNLKPKRDLYQVLPYPPLLYDPSNQ